MTKGVELAFLSMSASKMACFTARCISDSSKCHLPSSPVWIFFASIFLWKKPLPFKFLAFALILIRKSLGKFYGAKTSL
jgi:hypothetical protein